MATEHHQFKRPVGDGGLRDGALSSEHQETNSLQHPLALALKRVYIDIRAAARLLNLKSRRDCLLGEVPYWAIGPRDAFGQEHPVPMSPRTGRFRSHPQPATTYAEAALRAEKMRASQSARLLPECLTRIMTHGGMAEYAFVFVHGYMNGPPHFAELAQKFYDQGFNILMPPLPHHGLPDRMNIEHSKLMAEELAALGDEILDIAQGLGKQVVIVGFSGGGVVAAWAAQNREDLHLAVSISPAFGYRLVPTPLSAAAMRLFRILPNIYNWWDPVRKAEAGPAYSYPRYATHALVQFMRLGFAIRDQARRGPPAAERILVVTNGNEPDVNNRLTMRVVALWRQHSPHVTHYEFPEHLALPHDLIERSESNPKTEMVSPVLFDLITKQLSAATLKGTSA